MITVMMVVEATAGGTLRHVLDLARACHNRGAAVHLVCSTRRESSSCVALGQLRGTGIEVDELDMWREVHPVRDLTAAVRLRRIIARTKPDVLHLHSSKAGAIGRIAAAGLGWRAPAVVYTPHAYSFMTQGGAIKRRAYRFAEWTLLLWTDRVVAVSESERRVASRLGAADRVMTVPNGIDTAGVDMNPPVTGSRHSLRIGWLGRLVWQKQPEAAVTASFVLSRLGVEHELLMGGDGPGRNQVLAAIRERQAEKHIRMLGHVLDTKTFYRGIDILLMTSRYEGLPYAGLDAMAHGVPIVSFNVPGIRDLVTHGVTGLLAEPDDSGALAAHMARLARDPDLRLNLGSAARQRVAREFRLEVQTERLFKLYESLANRARVPTPTPDHGILPT